MESALITKNNEPQTIQLADAVFGCEFNEPLIHQVVCAYSAGSRQGTHAQKTRGEVSGGGKKPWRQKGTGRARAGSIRSPIWRGGGATFAVKPRDYSQKVNKKMYRGAMRSILSKLLEEKRLVVTEMLAIEESKTKLFVALLKQLGVERALIVLDEVNENLYLASRNIPNIKLCFPQQVSPVDLVKYPHTVITLSALKTLEEGLL